MSAAPLVVPARFNGPAGSANGGWVSGRLAGYLDPPSGCVQVRLLGRPPLQAPMEVHVDAAAGTAEARAGGVPVLRAGVAGDVELPPAPEPVGVEQAWAAEAGYPGRTAHPFPTCFVCGLDRQAGDGLLLAPGPVEGRPGTSATTWTPDPSLLVDGTGPVPAEVCWAALDCPGGWAVILPGRPMVLGTVLVQLLRSPEAGEPCVVVGAAGQVEGRKHWTASALYGPDDELLGRAGAIWVAIEPTG